MTTTFNKSAFFMLLLATSIATTASAQQADSIVVDSSAQSATYFDADAGCGCQSSGCGGASCGSSCYSGCDSGPFGRGLIKRSDHAFDDFISPMTNPVFFEDPRNLTEARAIFMNHNVPTAAGGGDVQLYALQLRARLTDNISLIATKDGYVTSSNPLVNDGWADLAAGLKFNLLTDVANQRLVSGGFTFEMPTGEADPLQGNGDGELHIFLNGGKRIGCNAHWLTATGFRLPMNTTDESQSWYWSNHLDKQIRKGVYVLAETNWYHWTKSGQDGPIPGIEGLDIINLGSPGVAGNDIVTGALGMKLKPSGNTEIGVAYEVPLTNREDILENRFTADWIVRY